MIYLRSYCSHVETSQAINLLFEPHLNRLSIIGVFKEFIVGPCPNNRVKLMSSETGLLSRGAN